MRLRLFDCSPFRRDLPAFVDGELRGASVLEILEHLEHCADCAEYADQLRGLGEAIRAEAPGPSAPLVLDGLASTVISRSKAEAAESWLGLLRRAREDWHWVIVGAGSIAATFVSTLFLSAILAFGPKPERDDSLSAVIANFRAPEEFLFVMAAPVGSDQEPVLWEVDDGGPAASSATVALASRSADRSPSEAEVVDALQAAVTRQGRVLRLDNMNAMQRRYTESLLQEMNRRRSRGSVLIGVDRTWMLNVHEVRLVAFTNVTAKGL